MANEKGEALYDAARNKGKAAADDLLGVHQERRRSENAPLDPSAQNAARAKADGWNNTGSGRSNEEK